MFIRMATLLLLTMKDKDFEALHVRTYGETVTGGKLQYRTTTDGNRFPVDEHTHSACLCGAKHNHQGNRFTEFSMNH